MHVEKRSEVLAWLRGQDSSCIRHAGMQGHGVGVFALRRDARGVEIGSGDSVTVRCCRC